MIDYFTLQTGSENPAFLTVIYTLLFSFSLSTLIAITYFKTTHHREISNNFINAIILSALISSTVVQAIGDSIAIGLGVLGALAIIRFRTNFRNPRNIIFMFAALAAGIATGVYGYTIAVVGTVGFCIVAAALFLTGFSAVSKSEIILRIVFEDAVTSDQINSILSHYCRSATLVDFREFPKDATAITDNDGTDNMKLQFQYGLIMKDEKEKYELISSLKSLGKWESVRMEVVDQREQFLIGQ